MHRRQRWIALGTAGLVVALALWHAVGWLRPAVPRATGSMTQSVYVWQRAWTHAVADAFGERTPAFDGSVIVLGAETAWTGGVPATMFVALDHARIAASSIPVGVALRIGPCPKEQLADPATAGLVVRSARRVLDDARANGWEPREIQIDFDSATSRLEDYRRWIEAVAREVAPVPVTITVLPSWMSSDAFGPLVQSTAGFVLQVHSVEKADLESVDPSLCDSASAIRWTEQAARYGVPFEVALPTYGYIAVLDESGALAGLVAEAGSSLLRAGARVREVRADPHAMARLVSHWSSSRPAGMRGIIWYRLPVEGDRLNWAWPTLCRVARGESPTGGLEVAADGRGGELVELVAVNRGDLDVELPRTIEASWSAGAVLLGADAMGGIDWERAAADAVRLTRTVGLAEARVRPGERRVLGWIRLSQATEVGIHVVNE